jgi:glycine dehydrogenase
MNLFEQQQNEFVPRHIGTIGQEKQMLKTIGADSIDELINKTVPASIRSNKPLNLPGAISEADLLKHLKEVSLKNKVYKNYIGQGYYDTLIPSVILRNVFENPGWYTQYTPYQAEISQGRLESLLNFQTMVSDLTALPIANASLLDEATAAAEAMNMFFHHVNRTDEIKSPKFFVDNEVFPQTKDVVVTRAVPLRIEVVFGDYKNAEPDEAFFGALIQYPNNSGSVQDYREFINKVHSNGGYVAMATDLLALTLLTAPGELGADVALGSAQRFGVPLGFGGPHAAFFSTKDDFKRAIPGRIIGVSIDAQGNRALRMALQTREQHIKREKATSNICTAQALLANMAAMFAVYHGPKGLKVIAERIHLLAQKAEQEIQELGLAQTNEHYFDTIKISGADATKVKAAAEAAEINFHYTRDGAVQISIDETITLDDIYTIKKVFAKATGTEHGAKSAHKPGVYKIQKDLQRTSPFLLHPNFNSHHSESQMMRYIKQLENKDLSLNTSMITLGSCTMKLNAASEMMPLSWAHWSKMHPFAPKDQTGGYQQICNDLENYLSEITGFDACSLQPNSGAQGEFAGLLAIRNYHHAKGDTQRNIVLIPISAHGTNPASAVMVGMKVVVVKALENGYIDVNDFRAKAEQYSANLAATMITYPSTYGIFEESVKEICDIVHQHGGQVYMDGANMNAQVGLTSPGLIGADVCHLNLHKTFSIPHGGGGPGMGPICVKEHLKPFLPGHTAQPDLPKGKATNAQPTLNDDSNKNSNISKSEVGAWVFSPSGQSSNARIGNDVREGAVSAAPYGSASILLISYAYIRMLGAEGVKKATEYAILNANYMKARLENDFDILYVGSNGTCAHEFIVDLRPFKTNCGIEAEDIAKRLIDYGFHAPTMSFPVPGTIMIEPTESEDKAELDRFCDALLAIRKEIAAIEKGEMDKTNNALKNAPHTQSAVCSSQWEKPYTREQAAFPLEYVKQNKFWPSVARVNNTHGDRNLICTCEPVESYMETEA